MIELISLKDRKRWDSIILSMAEHDFYHLSAYHELDSVGTPILLYFDNTKSRIALPLIIRDIEGSRFKDITSVYGYAGALSSSASVDMTSVKQFQYELSKCFDDLNIVSAFSRLHPLLPRQSKLLEGLGDIRDENLTVAIDLTLPESEQKKNYARSLKTQLNRLRSMGFRVDIASKEEEVSEFVRIYHANMKRLNANPYYYFPEEYFFQLLDSIDSSLFLAYYNGQVVSGSLCTFADKIIQAHLNATHNDFLSYSPLKLVIDEIRLSGIERHMQYLHLGGGYGGENNSLFQFKSRFSNTYHQFKTWRYVHNPEEYARLSEGKDRASSYFPLYRK